MFDVNFTKEKKILGVSFFCHGRFPIFLFTGDLIEKDPVDGFRNPVGCNNWRPIDPIWLLSEGFQILQLEFHQKISWKSIVMMASLTYLLQKDSREIHSWTWEIPIASERFESQVFSKSSIWATIKKPSYFSWNTGCLIGILSSWFMIIPI